MIEYSFEEDPKFHWWTHYVRLNGKTIAGITEETPKAAVDKFVLLCIENEKKIEELMTAYEERVQWNYNHPGQGKLWPAIRDWQKFKDALCKQAGIKDS